MSDTTGDDEPVRVPLDQVPFEEAVPIVMEVFGFTEFWARTYLAVTRGEEAEGAVPVEDEDEG